MISNKILDKLPKHLLGFIIEQDYESYTPINHAVWRYVMRLNYSHLSKAAHESYINGLQQTGISIDRIPEISEMNKILSQIGWAAVCVDGFIPPSAFMEFQAYNVLVIAADIRQIKHIEYTPAPDIIHEAAGHAPIIADPEYAAYLKLFGEIGCKAMSSAKDYELYEAIRHLSIIKESRSSLPQDIANAEKKLLEVKANMGKPSEMACIRNLHWWTVEYGLIGTLNDHKIYGAGLLSSIAESVSCLNEDVKKLPYSIKAADQSFDITTKQPQLFVTPDFKHLTEVLNEFADGMALRRGGLEGLAKAIASEATATCVFSSGLQVSGTFTEVITNEQNEPVYIKTSGATTLNENGKQLPGHGKDYHQHGYSTPVGRLKGINSPLEALSIAGLKEQGIAAGKETTFEFESGVAVAGLLQNITCNEAGKPLLLTLENCTVTYQNKILFEPEWGTFDMAVGEKIVSVFSGPADAEAFGLAYQSPKEKTHQPVYSDKRKRLHQLYQRVSNIRAAGKDVGELAAIFNTLSTEYPEDTLLTLEIYEILATRDALPEIRDKALEMLQSKKKENKRLNKLISDGLKLLKHPFTSLQ